MDESPIITPEPVLTEEPVAATPTPVPTVSQPPVLNNSPISTPEQPTALNPISSPDPLPEAVPEPIPAAVISEPTAPIPTSDSNTPELTVQTPLPEENPTELPIVVPQTTSSEADEVLQQAVQVVMAQLARDRLVVANQTRRDKKLHRKERIISLAQQKGMISNREIRDKLHISESSATNLANELIREGRLNKQGKPPQSKYTP